MLRGGANTWRVEGRGLSGRKGMRLHGASSGRDGVHLVGETDGVHLVGEREIVPLAPKKGEP